MENQTNIEKFNEETKGKDPQSILQYAYQNFKDTLTFATSLGEEDQVILDMIVKKNLPISVFTLDTGRLFEETYRLIENNNKRYPNKIKLYYPDSEALEDMVETHGINLFYDSVANRKLCCNIRKVQPLKRALKGKSAWITGLRRGQSITRSTAQNFEWDADNELIKINPLAYWSLDQVKEYIKQNDVDINPLHNQGFISIGCSSCTRAIKPGEDIRSGRWWWENPEQKECGLHKNVGQGI